MIYLTERISINCLYYNQYLFAGCEPNNYLDACKNEDNKINVIDWKHGKIIKSVMN